MANASTHGPQLVRLQYVLRRLHAGDRLTTRSAAEALAVSPRTIAADLRYLREIGIRLGFDHRAGTYVLRQPAAVLPPIALSKRDFAAFLVARFALESLGADAMASVLAAAAERLAEHLPESIYVSPDELSRTVRFDATPRPSVQQSTLNLLAATAAECRVVRMRYYAASRDEHTDREVEPYALLCHGGFWYLIAHCRLRKQMRNFRIDRISRLKQLREVFVRRAEFDLDDYVGPAFSVYHGEEAHAVRLRFSPYQARWMREVRWHESQVLVERSDGSLELMMYVRGLSDVARWALSYGSDCEVISPPVLRHRISAEARRMAAMYGNGSRTAGS